MTFKKILERSYTLITITLFLFIFSIVAFKFFIPKTIWMVSDFPYPTEYYSSKKVFLVLLSTIILFSICLLYYRLAFKYLNKTSIYIISFGYLLIILGTEFLISYIAFNPNVGDYAVIKEGIIAFCEGKKQFPDMDQFQLYPYNSHILLIGAYFAKLINSIDLSIKILPIATITGSIVFCALIIKKVTNLQGAHISIVLSLLNIFIYWQAPVFYTHTLVVLFLPATLYAYICLKTAKTIRKRVLWWVLLGLFAACTYIIRPTALSIAVAILLENVFRYKKKTSSRMLSSVIFCGLLIVGFNSTTTILHLSTDNNTAKMPYSHWIKMGLNEQTYGVWNLPDVTYPKYIKNTQERDIYNKKIIVQRLKDYGPFGLLIHFNEKVEREWVSSQFSMYRVGEWFQQKNDSVKNIVSNFNSKSYKVIDLYSFVIKFYILLGSLTAALLYKKFNENEVEILRICMISSLMVFAFLLLWETAPHYSYEAYVLMNIPASLGFYKLFTIINKNRFSKTE
jgi:hypothetical protein